MGVLSSSASFFLPMPASPTFSRLSRSPDRSYLLRPYTLVELFSDELGEFLLWSTTSTTSPFAEECLLFATTSALPVFF